MKTERVRLLIAGKEHSQWERYEIDSGLMIPADAWSVSLGASGQLPPGVVAGASVELIVGDDIVLTGYVDEINHSVSKTSNSLTLSGRDLAADLIDCSAPIFTKLQVGLKEVVAAITGEFKRTKLRIDADLTYARKKISTNPGQTAWDALASAAEINGLWVWFDPDGTLVVGGPDYSSPIVANLILRNSGKGNNVISLNRTSSHAGRYSTVTVYGQTPGTYVEQGKPDLRGSSPDEAVLRHRPKIVTDYDCENNGMCIARAQKLIDESRLHGLTITATVQGHRIVAPGQPSDGQLWKPGQRIHVCSEPHGINSVYFLMGRRFISSRGDGTRTILILKEDGVWLAGAHKNNKRRAGKTSVPLRIIPVA